jgi:hypothetical protein
VAEKLPGFIRVVGTCDVANPNPQTIFVSPEMAWMESKNNLYRLEV